jgi:hypothetical protein
VTPAADTALPRFTDITRQAGIDVRHVNGASAAKHLVETMGSGGLFVDYDGDAWMDVFLVDGGSPADAAAERRARHRLYRNRGDGTFEDATRASAITHRGYGMGACAGDYDGDGRVDLYVTNYGPNALFRNRGNGSFADVTAATGAGGSSPWSASCAFADLDRDGDLDLFVTSYVDAGPTETPFCGDARRGTRVYCHPLNFGPLPNAVLRNDGGVFTDVSAPSGIADRRGNGLGVVVADYDEDGWPDVFVANDSVPNFLFRNRGNWRFEEVGVAAGVAFATDGQARAGMGIDAGDYDGDLRLDLVITNLDFERHTLHRGLEQGLFADATSESGIGFATLPFVGFGALFLDYDNDSRLDIAIANGHIFDNAPQYRAGAAHAQRNLLLRNTTLRRFVEVGRTSGPGFALEKVSRGLAAADIDNDGDLDLLVTNNGQSPDLLRNDGGNRGNALLIRLAGPPGNPGGVGASVRVTVGSRTQLRTVKAGSSYLSQSDARVHVGLGTAAAADRVEVRWPSGRLETLRSVAANQLVTVREGEGIAGRVPLRR